MAMTGTSKAQAEKAYFEEARSWDADKAERMRRSERRAWRFVGALVCVALLEAVGLASLAPLKSVEPFVIRVDNNTGMVDVVSTLTDTDGTVSEDAQEALDKYWLAQYIRHREGYQWETRKYDRNLVGLMSSDRVQQEYAAYTDPGRNQKAPVAVYGKRTEVDTDIESISIINDGEMVNGEKHVTALVRYAKKVKAPGERLARSHWVATITFVYRHSPMRLKARELNPLGFQVISYRNDRATAGG